MTTDLDWIEQARSAWRFRGRQRPAFAQIPAAGQESVWDYPRPPALVPDRRRVSVYAGERRVAETRSSLRVLETGSPPTFYLPPQSVETGLLIPSTRRTRCEWKGHAVYFHVEGPDGLIRDAVWSYPEPFAEAVAIAGWYAFYPSALRCLVEDETARPQAGGFYGGWITSDVVGPFKGEPGTGHW